MAGVEGAGFGAGREEVFVGVDEVRVADHDVRGEVGAVFEGYAGGG